jgi:hypothetical protein
MFLTTIAIDALTHPLHTWLICLIVARLAARRTPRPVGRSVGCSGRVAA